MAMFPAQEIKKCFHNAPTHAQRDICLPGVHPQETVLSLGCLRTGVESNHGAQVSKSYLKEEIMFITIIIICTLTLLQNNRSSYNNFAISYFLRYVFCFC